MRYDKFEPFIIEAINEYLKKIDDKTLEINTALATRTLPKGLMDLIKQKLKDQVTLEKNIVVNQFNKIENKEKRHYLEQFGVPKGTSYIEKLQSAINKLNIEIKEHHAKKSSFLKHFALGTEPDNLYYSSIDAYQPAYQRSYLLKEAEALEPDLKKILIPSITELFTINRNNTAVYFLSGLYRRNIVNVLYKMHWAREITRSWKFIAQIEQKTEDLLSDIDVIKYLISPSLAPENTDYKTIKNHLSQPHRDELKKKVCSIKKEYDFHSLTPTEMSSVFEQFIAALRPHITTNPNFRDSLHQFDAVSNRKNDLRERREALYRTINQRSLGLGGSKSDKDKILRLSDLIKKLEALNITDTTTLYNLESVVSNWQLEEVNGKRNYDLFNHPSNALCRFFKNQPNPDEQLISQILTLVKEYPRQQIPVYQDPSPSQVLKSQPTFEYTIVPSIDAYNIK